jgi:hypothetical protein
LGISQEEEGRRRISHLESQQRYVEVKGAKDGASVMLRKVLLKPEQETEKPVQRNSFARTTCKTKDKVCKVIIDIGSTNNLVSTEMVEQLELKRNAHPRPYKVYGYKKDTR